MGATSVTGVGHGAAFMNKGPHNGRDVYLPALSPHVVAAGNATTAGGGTVTVTFPTPLTGSNTKYTVMLTGQESVSADAYVVAHDDTDGNFDSMVIHGSASKKHGWVVVKIGTP